jgi:hypothetical protein
VTAPTGGYIVPAAYASSVGDKLRVHGIEFRTLSSGLPASPTETFRATSATPAPATFEGRTQMKLEGVWRKELRPIPAGSLFVPIAQPKSQIVMALLEPQEPDSLASWGFFNAAFERKEYMEAYVAEDVAREMLRKDAALRQEFERKLSTDPEFAKSPSARLDFFYRRHSSWDEQYNLYPVLRTERRDW